MNFFSEELITQITNQTQLYTIQKNKANLQINDLEIHQFLGVLILMGIVHIPEFRMYWAYGSRFPEIADIISRQRLFLNII